MDAETSQSGRDRRARIAPTTRSVLEVPFTEQQKGCPVRPRSLQLRAPRSAGEWARYHEIRERCLFEKYHGKGFEIIGISLDQDKDALTGFIKEKNMAWPQYFDGQGWQSKLAAKYGINSIPMNFLVGKDGKIIGSGLRGEELDSAVAKAVGQ